MKRKIGISIYMFLVTIIILTKESYCYLDPSAMTYLIQIGAALCITVGTGFGIFIYKIKRFIKNRNHKKDDENKNSEKIENHLSNDSNKK